MAAARSVLIELVHLLGEYRDRIVIVGGWVPDLLLKGAERPHTGSTDLDVAGYFPGGAAGFLELDGPLDIAARFA